MTRVVHVRDGFDVYIGRFHRSPRYGVLQRSKWHNPFRIGDEAATAEEAVALYEAWVKTQPALVAAAPIELRGKRLGCWCRGRWPVCHGDVLAELAEGH